MELKRLNSEYIRHNYLILLVKALIIGLFVLSIVQGRIKNVNYWETTGNTYFLLKEISFYRPSIILLVPVIGVFLNKKIGWILIQSYFYFLLFRLVYPMKYSDFNYEEFLVQMIIGIPIVLIILLMNNNKIGKEFYGLSKSELISKNIVATSIGILMVLSLTWIKFYLP